MELRNSIKPQLGSLQFWLLGLVVLFALFSCSSTPTERQAMVHDMGGQVMPFDLGKTIHSFELTTEGGIQEVRIKNNSDSSQLGLIRHHLQHEAMLFSSGQYSDPASLHGQDMPGLKALAAGFANMNVTYTEIPTGAKLTFQSQDPALVLAVHKWFAAQLSDHGADAIQSSGI